jgi:hypothetical protein
MRFRKLRIEPFRDGSIVEFCYAEFNKLRASLKTKGSHRSIRLESFCDTDLHMYEKVPPPLCLMNRIFMRRKRGGGGPKMWHGAGGGDAKSI